MNNDLYKILGVDHNASQSDIKKAYHKLVKQYHPDVNPGNKDAEEKFKEINAAYAILGDADKRAKYDQFSLTDDNASSYGFQGNPFSGFNINFDDMFTDSPFSNFFNMKGRQHYYTTSKPTDPQNGENLQIVLDITLLEAFTGTEKTINITSHDTCKTCNGSGAKPGSSGTTPCMNCHGTGQMRNVQSNGFMQQVVITVCPVCHGSGQVIKDKCDECHGNGRISNQHSYSIKVPAGVEHNGRLRVKGGGDGGRNGGNNGDLYIVVNIEDDPNFKRSRNNLYSTIHIAYPQAVLGASVNFTNIDGEVIKVNIPKGTQYSDIIKVKNKGFPYNYGNSRGNLELYVVIDVPKEITDKEREILEELNKELSIKK